MALADSVNPCTLAVMLLLLAVLLSKKGRKDAVLGGILFIVTVYTMYTLYGLGLLTFITTTGLYRVVSFLLPLLILVLALIEIRAYVSYKPGFSSLEMPLKLRPIAGAAISAINNPLTAVPVAVLCSVLLLPCSSGPYLTALFLMKGIDDLLLYNAVFVLPMVALLALVSLGASPERVQELRQRYIREIHLISGLLLLMVFFFLLPIPQATSQGSSASVLVVASPTCPHCQHLEEVLREMNVGYVLIPPDEGRRLAEERGVNWDGGVPLLIYRDIVIEGFPAKGQEVNGYFRGEENLCKTVGTPVYDGNVYLYCRLKNGAILGNRHVLEMFIGKKS